MSRGALSGWRGLALRAGAAAVLVNAPFWVLGLSFFMSRAVFDVDHLIALALMAVAPWVGLIALVVTWGLDAAIGQSLTYHFLTPLDFLGSIRFASTLGWSDLLGWEAAVALLPFSAALIALRPLALKGPRAAGVLIAMAALLGLLDAANGSSMLTLRDGWRLPFNLAGSPATTVAVLVAHSSAVKPLRNLPSSETIQGLVDVPSWAARHPGRAVLVVIVESLGAPVQPTLRSWLDTRVAPTGYEVRLADLPFRGSTTSGELRALCKVAGHYQSLDLAVRSQCLPARLATLGWESTGLHGFSRRMFDRESWWPKLGLGSTHFVDSPWLADAPRCGGAFGGACDAFLVERALGWLEKGNRFAYVLTLNTHLPLPPTPVPPELAGICKELATPPAACALVGALGRVLTNVATRVSMSSRRPLVLVVGDHAPPFKVRETRQAFRQDVVPAYALVPRD